MADFVCLDCKQIIGNLEPIEKSICPCGSVDIIEIKDIGLSDRIKRTLYFIVGPTGSGKNHIINSLSSEIENVPSVTTRKPRTNEVHGVDYYFINHKEMEELQSINKLCESICFGGETYGINADILIDRLFYSEKNLSIILEPVGLEQMIKYIKNNYSLFKFNNFDIEIIFLDIPRPVRLINMLKEVDINETDLSDFYIFNSNPLDICDGDLYKKILCIEKVLDRLIRNGDNISNSMNRFIMENKQSILKLSRDTGIYINIKTLRTKKEIDKFIEEVGIGPLKLHVDRILKESNLDQLKRIEQILYKKIIEIESDTAPTEG